MPCGPAPPKRHPAHTAERPQRARLQRPKRPKANANPRHRSNSLRPAAHPWRSRPRDDFFSIAIPKPEPAPNHRAMTDMPPLALLAGGMATRLRPLTQQLPKSLLQVAGEPFIAHQLRLMRRERIERVVICVGFLSGQIKAFVGDGSRFGVKVS